MTSLYIHIPFCKKKCNYCDFVSYSGKEALIDEYVDALYQEISSLALRPSSLETIYFGGGTPTLLEPRHFEKILNTSLVPRPPSLEISIEANPGTADKAKLKELRKLGINRLSIGAQSFNDEHLKTLGRIHDSKDIFKFYDDARSAGFDNINLDLIFTLPDQTLEDWKKDIRAAIDLEPNHLSTYNLQVEEGTPLWEMSKSQAPNPKQYQNPKFKIPNEDEELAMYEHAIETLTSKGYHHYEISNFAKPGFECKHNINYWKNGSYIGVGVGAHSHVNGRRRANPDSVESYIGCGGGYASVSCIGFVNRTTNETDNVLRYVTETDKRETIFMGLRLLKGLSVDKFQGFEKELAELIKSGLLMRENSHVKLTRKGLYLANEVFEKFV